jgi:Asp-tRNA(Asn)/Glu-tRNA(Gln) amidotransferase A subunit family amidase
VLARITEANPAVNAIVTLAAEQAAAAARGLDAQAARGSFAGPLHGLPIAVKDLAETAGIRTTFGSPLFASYVPDFDAPHVARLKQAGAVVIGKTNTPEFGAGSQTFNRVPMTTYIDWMRSCSRITVTAHPGVSVPARLTAAGLPVGLQLVGRYGADRRLLEIAAAIMDLPTPA